MIKSTVSIVISSYNRLPLFRRTLWAIANRPPSVPFEVVVCDDGSTEDVLGELRLYSSVFPWKLVRFDGSTFEKATGLKKFLNNPSVTNNIAYQHAEGNLIFQVGNEVIAWDQVFDDLIADSPEGDQPWLVMSTTYDIPQQYLDLLDPYGSNLTAGIVGECVRWPLQSVSYRSDVTNYISLAPRALWETLAGYDERYYGGIAAEDSDFVRRARTLPGFTQVISEAVSLHQFHGGRTKYYLPKPKVISKARWEEGCAINRAVYDAWNGSTHNPQKWPWGKIGVKEVIANG